MSVQTLLLDVGNTSVKYSFAYIGETEKRLDVNTVEPSQINKILSDVDRVLICSVRSDAFNKDLSTLIFDSGCKCEFVHPQAKQHGLINSYPNIENMGSDRWVGMLGAKHLVGDSFLLVDAGTAITLDATIKNKHLGGWIVAGKHTAKKALLANTKRVFDRENNDAEIVFGKDTPDCVEFGSNAMATGVVLSAIELLNRLDAKYSIVVSGGDRKLIVNSLNSLKNYRVIENPNIVLVGLNAIVNYRLSA